MKKILILFTFFIYEFSSNQLMECILDKIFDNVIIKPTAVQSLQNYYSEQDYNIEKNISKISKFNLLNNIDFTTKIKVEEILMNFNLLPEQIKSSIRSCNINIDSVKKRCEQLYPDGCDKIGEFLYAPKCPKNHQAIGMSLCVPLCPKFFTENQSNPLTCEKGIKSQRSSKLSNIFTLKKINFRNVFKVLECPENWSSLEHDICIRNCPQGWEDKGRNCEKPVIQRRGHEIFQFLFNYDGIEQLF